ncbi:MAG: Gfo/Idh/MocA family oxidoreductase [Clostridiaceae bacterium]|nr:Gfo/Idh/MocA family oxidoreductase [Clostridiaceae bacterium]
MKKIRYGILSTAQIARNKHLPAALSTTNSEIVAISSRDYETARNWTDKLGIKKAYGSYEELINDPEIDAVINPLPNSLHLEWTLRALDAKKHVLCEKPITMNAQEADELINASKKSGFLVMEAFTHRFKDEVVFIRDLISSGRMGKVYAVYSSLVFYTEKLDQNIRSKKSLGGGVLLDGACYCVSLSRFILSDEVKSVQGCQSIKAPYDVDTTFTGTMQFKGGTLASFISSMEVPYDSRLLVLCEKGKIVLEDFFDGNKVFYKIGDTEYVKEFPVKDRFALQMEHFSDCILSNKKPIFSLEDARNNMLVLDALKKSAENGSRVIL